jgi:two-component system response regulator DctR
MRPLIDALVFVVDDDASVRDALAWLLRSRRLQSACFESTEAFQLMVTQGAALQQPCCLLLDVRMPGLSGLALFDWLIERGLQHAMPVIFLTGHADVPTAVDAVKRGAFDFCEKPCSDNALVDRVEQALAQSRAYALELKKIGALQERQNDLTERERKVMALVVEGLPNKLIADRLDISVRTVEVHRARVFEKMDVKSAVELVNLLRHVPG